MSVPEKLRALRLRTGLSMEELARRAGYAGASSWQHYENETLFTQPYVPIKTAKKLIRALVGLGSPPITVEDVMALAGTGDVLLSQLQPQQVEVIAVAEGGVWRDDAYLPVEERYFFPLPPLQGFERVKIFGLKVRGSAMNKLCPDGSVAYFVRAQDQPPADGNYVVVAAKQRGRFEVTIKELQRDAKGRQVLLPISTEARYQTQIRPQTEPGMEVEIIGVVIGKFEPIPLAARPAR